MSADQTTPDPANLLVLQTSGSPRPGDWEFLLGGLPIGKYVRGFALTVDAAGQYKINLEVSTPVLLPEQIAAALGEVTYRAGESGATLDPLQAESLTEIRSRYADGGQGVDSAEMLLDVHVLLDLLTTLGVVGHDSAG